MSTDPHSMTVSVYEIVRRVFPQGTNRRPAGSAEAEERGLSQAPGWPPDAFAVAALLLERAGVYQLLAPGTSQFFDPPWTTIDPAVRRSWMEAGQQWRMDPRVPKIVQDCW